MAMAQADIELAPGQTGDLDQIVDLFARSRAVGLPFLPILHSRDEDRAFLGQHIVLAQLTAARFDGRVAAFLVRTPGWIEQLYVDPDLRGRGIGQRLLDWAKAGSERLDLWCFADNHAARAFYAAQGFIEIGGTAGDNEAGLPDILFRWHGQSSLRNPICPSAT
jgi:GNAT superfamily N-acetyltransferase